MTFAQQMITIALCASATAATRFLPFVLFSGNRQTPKYIRFLGDALAPAIFAMLVVYCLKNVSILSAPFGLPEAIAILVIVVLHLWKKQTLLSIGAGTVCYMLLVQLVF